MKEQSTQVFLHPGSLLPYYIIGVKIKFFMHEIELGHIYILTLYFPNLIFYRHSQLQENGINGVVSSEKPDESKKVRPALHLSCMCASNCVLLLIFWASAEICDSF